MSEKQVNLETCPCCGGEARVQFEVYGTWVRVYCVECGLTTMSAPCAYYDPTPAVKLWNERADDRA